MRLHIGEIPDSPDFVPDARWRQMREPTPWVMQLLALPVGFGLTLALAVLWMAVTPVGRGPAPSTGTALAAVLVTIPVHEFLHLLLHPRTGDSIAGFWPSRLLFYTHYHNALPCRRYHAILLAPLVVLSVLPLAVCALASVSSPFLAVLSVTNALVASGDLFAVLLLLVQVPARATLRNKGWRLYWTVDA